MNLDRRFEKGSRDMLEMSATAEQETRTDKRLPYLPLESGVHTSATASIPHSERWVVAEVSVSAPTACHTHTRSQDVDERSNQSEVAWEVACCWDRVEWGSCIVMLDDNDEALDTAAPEVEAAVARVQADGRRSSFSPTFETCHSPGLDSIDQCREYDLLESELADLESFHYHFDG